MVSLAWVGDWTVGPCEGGRRGSLRLVVAASFLSTEANDSNGGEGLSGMGAIGKGSVRRGRYQGSSFVLLI